MHFIPTYSSWLNLVERFFALITDKAIRRGSFRSVRELVHKIDHFVAHHNTNCKPFIWTATADSILAKLQRLCCTNQRDSTLAIYWQKWAQRDIVAMKATVETVHGGRATKISCASVLVNVEPGVEGMGTVHIFSLTGQPETDTAYAWVQAGKIYTALMLDPIKSPADAVRAWLIRHRIGPR